MPWPDLAKPKRSCAKPTPFTALPLRHHTALYPYRITRHPCSARHYPGVALPNITNAILRLCAIGLCNIVPSQRGTLLNQYSSQLHLNIPIRRTTPTQPYSADAKSDLTLAKPDPTQCRHYTPSDTVASLNETTPQHRVALPCHN